MAATALVATADGEVTFSKMIALDSVLESIQDLQIYDPHVAVDIYRNFADAIADNPEQGRDTAIAAASKIVGDHDAVGLVIQVAIAISKADGELSAQESDVIHELCEMLGVRIPKDREIPQ